jgi:hypothetical protein
MDRMNSVHEMMRKRHMEFLKKRLESDSYDALFGWRNRLRDGLPQQMWVKGSDMLKAKGVGRDSQETVEAHTTSEQNRAESSQPRSTVAMPPELPREDVNTALNSSYKAQQPSVKTTYFSADYDPISNRMIHKKSEEIRHYGQDLNTSTKYSLESSNDSLTKNHQISAQEKASLRSEFAEYKARRLPESFEEQLSNDTQTFATRVPTENHRPSYSISDAAQRAKLENSFQQVHRSGAAKGAEELSRPIVSARDGQFVEQARAEPSNSEITSRAADYDAVLQNLSARIKDVGKRVDRLQSHEMKAAQQAQKPAQAPQATSQANQYLDLESQRESETLLRKQFREFRQQTTKQPQQPEEKGSRSEKPVSFRQLPKEDQVAPPVQEQPQQHVYEILAFDPVTSEVNTTRISAPMAAKEESIALSDALARLAEPAKFLPHLRLLQLQGFQPVAATKNMLVLRGAPSKIDTSATGSQAGTVGTEIPKNATSEAKYEPDYFGYGYEVPRYHRHREWRRRRRFLRRVLFWGATTGAVVYASGVYSGTRRDAHSGRRSKQDSYPETEEEMYRVMRDAKSRKRESYPGMRKVTIPKDKDA